MSNDFKRGSITKGSINHLSASTIMSMKTCGKAVYFQKILGIPNTTQYSKTVIGLAIHSALEYWGRCKIDKKKVTLKDVVDKFNEYFDKHYTEITIWGTDTYEQLREQGAIALDLFFKKFKDIRPEKVESRFVIDRGEGNLPILGFIDLVTEDGCIYDYKCGKRATTAKYIGNMTIYAWQYLLETGAFPKEVATIAIKWRSKNKQDYVADWEKHVIPVDMKYLEYIQNECDDTEKMIKAGVFNRATADCGLCKNCCYRKECGVIIL